MIDTQIKKNIEQLPDDTLLMVRQVPKFDPRIDNHDWANSGIYADMYKDWVGDRKTVQEIFDE